MTDFEGTEVKVGDEVVFLNHPSHRSFNRVGKRHLKRGKVLRVTAKRIEVQEGEREAQTSLKPSEYFYKV